MAEKTQRIFGSGPSDPFCLDVSSGAETVGEKDKNTIMEHVSILRSEFMNKGRFGSLAGSKSLKRL